MAAGRYGNRTVAGLWIIPTTFRNRLPIYGAAGPAVDDLIASQRPITDALTLVTDVTLNDLVKTQFGENWPATRVFSTLLREQIHHGAEISLLRDLYRNRK
jgi:hypothetical protein